MVTRYDEIASALQLWQGLRVCLHHVHHDPPWSPAQIDTVASSGWRGFLEFHITFMKYQVSPPKCLHLSYLAEDEDTNSATYRWFAGTWSAHLEGGKINKSSWLDAREEHAGNMEGNSEDHILSFCIHFQALWAAQGLPVTVKVSVSCLHTLQETWHHSTATTTP